MEIESVKTKTLSVSNNRYLNSSVLQYDLPVLIRKMKDSTDWKNGDLAATILLKSPDKQIVLTILHDDTEVKSIQTGDSITVQLIEGKMEFQTHNKIVILNNGQFLTLRDKIKFTLTSLEDSVFLLTFLTAS